MRRAVLVSVVSSLVVCAVMLGGFWLLIGSTITARGEEPTPFVGVIPTKTPGPTQAPAPSPGPVPILAIPAESQYVMIGCVIRNTGKGWYCIDNAGHEPLGVTEVETGDDSIIIHYPMPEGTKVISFSATPDETMAAAGYTVGASVGADRAVIFIYDADHNLIDPHTYVSSSGNIWIMGIMKTP